MPPGYPPFRHCQLFFYFFSIFCIQHISVSLPATYTHSRQHIPFGFCLLTELYAFIIFSFRSVLILSQVATLSSGFSRPHLTRIILIHPQARTSRSGLPATRFPYLFLSKHSQPFTSHHTFFRLQPAASYPHHSYPSTSQNLAFRIAGHTLPVSFSFKAFSAFHQPLHFLPASAGRHPTRSILILQKLFHPHPALPVSTTPPAPHKSPILPPDALPHLPMPPGYLLSPPLCRSLPLLQYPIFSFFFLLLFFFFSFFFFLSSSPFLFIFSLHFLFSRLFLSSFLFSFSYPLFLFSFFYFYHHACFSCAPSQRLKNRT